MTVLNAAQVHVGDIGTQIQIKVVDQDGNVVSLAPATTKEICFEKPSGAKVTKTAVFPVGGDGTDGLMEYITIADDLDEAGPWQIQGRVVFVTGEWRTEVDTFRVYPNIC